MKAPDKVDIGVQSLILGLGMALYETTIGMTGQTKPDQIDAMIERIVAAVGDTPYRRMLGILQRLDAKRQRMRVSAVAYTAWQTLRYNNHKVCIGEIAAAIADPRLTPAEGLLLSRNECGRMIQRLVLIGGSDQCDRPVYTHALLPSRTLMWLSGGPDALGYLSYARSARAARADDEQAEEPSTPGSKPVPSAKALFLAVKQRVHGCDPVLKCLTSRISLAVCRAEMLARGVRDTGVGNQVLLVFGASGTGKTYAVEEIARASNLVFSSFDASGLSGLGWSGSSVEDALKVALAAANGNSKRAANSIICYDEIDKVLKAGLHEHRQSAQADLLRPLGGHSVVVGGKRNYDGPPMTFDCGPTIFVLSGVFEGLAELMGRKGRRAIGFHSVEGEKVHRDFRAALQSYGCLAEVAGRISCCVRMPEPEADTIAQWVVSEHGVVDGFNRVLASRGIVLFPLEPAVNLLSDWAVQERSYFRGVKHLVGSVVEEVIFDGTTGTVMLDAALVRRAIDRAGGIVHPDEQAATGGAEPLRDDDADVLPEQAGG